MPAIADAQHGGGGLLPAPRSHLHRHGAGDPPEEHLLRQREQVGPPAGDAPQPLVPVHTGGDAGVHPGAHHVQPQLPVAVHQVKGRLRTGGQGLQIGEALPVPGAEQLEEVVARPLGHVGHRQEIVARRPVHHLVEGAVPAAGVEPGGYTRRGGPLRDFSGLPRLPGIEDLVGNAQPGELFLQPPGGLPLPGGGVDDKNMADDRRPLPPRPAACGG